jgi:BASS family bile acid:Na+ symporter
LSDIDNIKVNFSENFWVLGFCLGFLMFSVALDLKKDDFKQLLKNPKASIAGVFSQYIVFPFLSFLLVKIIQPHSSIALGMILVAACPGGNMSNFFTHTAKGNVALSISLTGLSTILAPIATPIIFSFYASLDEGTRLLMKDIELDFLEMLKNVSILLLLPLIIGIFLNHNFPNFVNKSKKTIKRIALLIFILFLVFAIKANISVFIKHIHLVLFIVFIQDIVGFASGFVIGKIFKLKFEDCKAISIETGIHNVGLGLVLIFTFFGGMGGMALIAAWWGIWHLFAGMLLANYWRSKAV